jgi:hypothetical protein
VNEIVTLPFFATLMFRVAYALLALTPDCGESARDVVKVEEPCGMTEMGARAGT